MSESFKSFITAGVGTSEQVVYTCPADTESIMTSCSIANVTASPITASVRLQKPGPVYGYLVKDAVIAPGNALVIGGVDQKFIINANNTLRVTTSALGSADVIVGVLERGV